MSRLTHLKCENFAEVDGSSSHYCLTYTRVNGLPVKMMKFRPLFLLFMVPASVSGEIFTSIDQFQDIIDAEYDLSEQLLQLAAAEEEKVLQLRQLAYRLLEHSEAADRNREWYVSNPVNAFLLVKRISRDVWKEARYIIETQNTTEALDYIKTSIPHVPDEIDMLGAVKSLHRIQDTYQLDTTQIAEGLMGEDSEQLSGRDCYEIGQLAYSDHPQDYYHAVLWFSEALARLQAEGNNDNNELISQTMAYLSYSLYEQGNVEAALDMTNEWLEYEPDNSHALHNKIGYEALLAERGPQKEFTNERIMRGYHGTKEFKDYEKLCRGEEILPNPYKNQLTCRYKKTHPYSFLWPVKEEIMYLDPFVAVYHDVLADSEIATVKRLALPKLHRSVTFKREGKYTEIDEFRISKTCWLQDINHPHIARISSKVATITDLSMSSSEELQVLNYGLGGQYEPHTDWMRDAEKLELTEDSWFNQVGNRISTSLIYMSDVAAGGATVFPQLGISVFPEKGAMLFWYNLHQNGTGDERTVHAGCPVMIGSKWVCNKWIHEMNQEFRRPCQAGGE